MASQEPLVLSAEEAERQFPPQSAHRGGKSVSREVQQVLGLQVGKAIIWSPCFDHTILDKRQCRAVHRISATARRRGLRIRTWHTKEGDFCVVREA